jgi:hypothetical protein
MPEPAEPTPGPSPNLVQAAEAEHSDGERVFMSEEKYVPGPILYSLTDFIPSIDTELPVGVTRIFCFNSLLVPPKSLFKELPGSTFKVALTVPERFGVVFNCVYTPKEFEKLTTVFSEVPEDI